MAYTAIDNPELYFQTVLYTGTGSSNAVTFDGDEDMAPDMVWLKNRNSTQNHFLTNSVTANEFIIVNLSNAADTNAGYTQTYDSDGFTLQSSAIAMNTDTNTYVAWCWKESATSGFDIVSYTGNGTTQDISHSLSAKPDFMILRLRSGSGGWLVYHSSLGATKAIYLNETGAVGTNSSGFNDTEPTSSVFSLGNGAYANTSDGTQIAYCFAEKQGYSKFGSYTGNGNADGTFCFTGFRPARVMLKSTAAATNWQIMDNKRNTFNPVDLNLKADANAADEDFDIIDMLSNGFKLRYSSDANVSGNTIIYMAFAEAPFVNSNGVPCNAR